MRRAVGRLLGTALLLAVGALGASRAEAQAPAKVTIAQTSIALGFSPVAIAADEGFFKKEGLDVDVQIVSAGDPQVLAAIYSGGAQFGAMTLIPAVQAAARGEKLLLVSPFVRQFVIQFVINPKTAQQRGITADMPLKEKFLRAKGLTVGTLDVGGGLDLLFRVLSKQYGLNADSDFTVTAIHSYPGLLAACQRGQIGIAETAIPFGTLGVQQEGLEMFADFWHGAVPQFAGAMHQGLVVSGSFAQQHPDTVLRMHSAMDETLRFMQAQPDKIVADLHKRYPNLSAALIRTFLVTDAASFAPNATAPRHGFAIIRDFVAQNLLPQASKLSYEDFVIPAAQEKTAAK